MASYEEGVAQTISPGHTVYASGPTAVLLTPRPVETLQLELKELSDMGVLFRSVVKTIFVFLKEDQQSVDLRHAMRPFVRSMYLFADSMEESFHFAKNFYSNEIDDYLGGNLGKTINSDDVAKLANAQNQRRLLKHVVEVQQYTESAIVHLKDAVPLLPDITRVLHDFVEEYKKRDLIMRQRSNSWLPFFWFDLHDQFTGKVDSMTIPVSDVEGLLEDMTSASKHMHNLQPFLDRWHSHFKRLEELSDKPEAFSLLGYTSSEDFIRLYYDRLLCIAEIDQMQLHWMKVRDAFIYGSDVLYNSSL